MAEEVASVPHSSRCCKHTVVYTLNCWFYRLGYVVAGFPRSTIAVVVVFSLLCGVGLRGFTWEKRMDKLWVPQGTRELRDKDLATEYFPDVVKAENMVVSARSGELATREAMLQLVELLNLSASVRFEEDGNDVTFTDLCFVGHRGNATYCHTESVLDVFYDINFEETPQRGYLEVVKAKIATLSDSDIKRALLQPTLHSWLGGTLKRDDILSIATDSNGDVQPRAFRVAIYMKDDDHLRDWEHAWIDKFETQGIPGMEALTWRIQASCSKIDAMEASLVKDLPKMFMGYFLLLVYVCIMMGRPHLVRMRISLGLSAVLSVLLAIISTAGVASLLGQFWGPVHSVLPLLLLGVGADDAFVIANSFDRVSEVSPHPLRERLALALSKAGSAVTKTSLTRSCAFFIGSLTVLPALSHFAVWAGIGVLLTYLFQITFFVACLTIDAQRQEQKRMDLLFCIRRDTSGNDCCGLEHGLLRRFFERQLAPFLLRTPVRFAVLGMMVVSMSICGYGVTLLHQDFSQSLFFMGGSYIQEYHDAEQFYFPERNLPVYVYTGRLAYDTAAVQQKMQHLCSETTGVVATSSVVKADSTSCWYSQMRHSFNLSCSEVFEEASFYPKLQTFIAGAGGRFSNHLSFDGEGKLNATRFASHFVHLSTNDVQVEAMHALQDDVDSANLDGAFPFAGAFTFFAQYAVLQREALQSVGLALAVVFVVTLGMIGNPIVCIVVFAGVAATVVDILGIVHYWGMNLNSVTIIILAVSVGLSVDFSAHIGLEFMESIGSREERMTEALGNLGPSLVHGGTSTFLVVSLLLFAKSYIFRIFFKMLFLTLGLGMLHGLVFVPVLLSLFGPSGFYGTVEEKRDANVRITTMIRKK